MQAVEKINLAEHKMISRWADETEIDLKEKVELETAVHELEKLLGLKEQEEQQDDAQDDDLGNENILLHFSDQGHYVSIGVIRPLSISQDAE